MVLEEEKKESKVLKESEGFSLSSIFTEISDLKLLISKNLASLEEELQKKAKRLQEIEKY